MKKISRYQINDTFRITGQGLMFAGHVSEGFFNIGDWIEFNYNDTYIRRKIAGIEGIRSLKQKNNCGLLIETINDKEIEEFRNWHPNGIAANIYSSLDMKIEIDKYVLELIDESTDISFEYQQQYSNEGIYQPTSQIGIRLYQDNEIISSAIINSIGGASTIHQTSQIATRDSLTICCSESVFKLSIPKLELLWLAKADEATCFQIFKYENDYIIHGELNITRIASSGTILWQNSGADIFTTEKRENNFEINDKIIQVRDWNNKIYKFDIEGNEVT